MARILLIETSTVLCSVALAVDGVPVSSRRDPSRVHASLTAVFCDEVLKEAGVSPGQLDAVCISEGPGSYTGLRVGLSTAKGIAFGTGAKLLSVSSLDILAAMGASADAVAVVPMIDARRMEVFCAEYSPDGLVRRSPVESRIVESGSFSGLLAGGDVVFIGDGALKCREVIGGGCFVEAWPEAGAAMATLAQAQWDASAWRDVAYFEPFYLKDFVATTPRKLF